MTRRSTRSFVPEREREETYTACHEIPGIADSGYLHGAQNGGHRSKGFRLTAAFLQSRPTTTRAPFVPIQAQKDGAGGYVLIKAARSAVHS